MKNIFYSSIKGPFRFKCIVELDVDQSKQFYVEVSLYARARAIKISYISNFSYQGNQQINLSENNETYTRYGFQIHIDFFLSDVKRKRFI